MHLAASAPLFGMLVLLYQNCGGGFQVGSGHSSSVLEASSPEPSLPSPSPEPGPQPGPSPNPSPAPAPPPVVNLPTGLGWDRIPNTKLRAVCPTPDSVSSFSYPGSCSAVIGAWSGAVADTKRQRLLIWGGGHNDYYGNEVYSLNLGSKKMERLTNPTFLAERPSC